MRARRAGIPAAGLLCLALLLSMGSRASAGEDPLAEAQSLVEQGTRAVEVGSEKEDEARIRVGLALYRRALGLFRKALEQENLGTAEKTRIRAHVADVESRIRWYEEILDPDDGAVPTIEVPARKRGESASAWGRRVHALYGTTEAPVDRAVLARALAAEAGAHALPTLYALFETESAPKARAAVHAALAHVGTPRVAKRMGSYARQQGRAHWASALDVICRCLAKPETEDAEAPFLRAVRRFHALKDRTLTLQLLDRLDALGSAGTAAIGEVLYVRDFGVHAQAIERLATRRDRRAAPPLIHALKDVPFDATALTPAHEALLSLGWHAVPALVARAGDKGTDGWLPWTLQEITGKDLGTDRSAWRTWWKAEKTRHPEVFKDPERRVRKAVSPAATGPDAK